MKSSECHLCLKYNNRLFASPDKECIHTCIGCKLWHEKVECSGIYYCPNPYCRACGASWIAYRCSSKKEEKGGITVDDAELRTVRLAAFNEADLAVRNHIAKTHPELFVTDAAYYGFASSEEFIRFGKVPL